MEFGNLHALELLDIYDELCEIGEAARLIGEVGNFEGPSIKEVRECDRATRGVWEFARIGCSRCLNCVKLEKLPNSLAKLATLKDLLLNR